MPRVRDQEKISEATDQVAGAFGPEEALFVEVGVVLDDAAISRMIVIVDVEERCARKDVARLERPDRGFLCH